MGNLIAGAIVILIVIFAVRRVIKQRGGCGCGCSGCSGCSCGCESGAENTADAKKKD